jgi:endonuclease YncB( thermonuclease family)
MLKLIPLILLITISDISVADEILGKVISIADGDTITVLDSNERQHKVRLLGIDAPEKNQPFGNQSKQSLTGMVFGKTVVIDYNKRDKYARIIGKVLLDGNDINLEQVKRGLAWHYKQYEKEQELADRSIYANGEYLARRDSKGLWADQNPVPPWEFRKNRSKNSK